jgi:hypothetical protein
VLHEVLGATQPQLKQPGMKTFRTLLLMTVAFGLVTISSLAANKHSVAFRAKILAAIRVGTPAPDVLKFLNREKFKIMEFSNPRAISSAIIYNKGLMGYKVTTVAFLLDRDDRVKELIFTDDFVGL